MTRTVEHATVIVLDEEEQVWKGSLDELIMANDGLSPDEISKLRTLSVDDTVLIGGGAAPLFTIQRTT